MYSGAQHSGAETGATASPGSTPLSGISRASDGETGALGSAMPLHRVNVHAAGFAFGADTPQTAGSFFTGQQGMGEAMQGMGEGMQCMSTPLQLSAGESLPPMSSGEAAGSCPAWPGSAMFPSGSTLGGGSGGGRNVQQQQQGGGTPLTGVSHCGSTRAEPVRFYCALIFALAPLFAACFYLFYFGLFFCACRVRRARVIDGGAVTLRVQPTRACGARMSSEILERRPP